MTYSTYILPTAFTLICSSVLYTLMRYFSSQIETKANNKLPKIPEKWWKPDNRRIVFSIKPYNVTFSQQLVKDLQTRLNNTRKDSNKNYSNNVQEILDYWVKSYDYHKRQIYINKYLHFTTNIQGLDIHFIRVKPTYEKKKVLPLLMLHGWPSSVIEFYKIIPLLTTSRREYDFVFEVIVPSLPGFGFSSEPTEPGFSCADMSVILKNLMRRLGHDQFYVQGSNWSACIARIMSSLFPEHVLGTYSSISALYKLEDPSYSSLAQIKKRLMLSNKLLEDTKYFQIQAIKPETTGVGLNDSPAALTTYIIEKFLISTNCPKINDEFLQKYSYDDVIDNLMIYWTSKSITAAMRIYAEQFTKLESEFIEQLINFTKPRISSIREQLYFILNPYTVKSGFPAFEEPEQFADKIWANMDSMKMFNEKRKNL